MNFASLSDYEYHSAVCWTVKVAIGNRTITHTHTHTHTHTIGNRTIDYNPHLLYEATYHQSPEVYFIIHTVLYYPGSKVTSAHIVGGSLLWRAHFESLRVAEAKNAATINRLMSKRRSVLYFPNSTLLSRVKGHKAHRSCHGSFRAS